MKKIILGIFLAVSFFPAHSQIIEKTISQTLLQRQLYSVARKQIASYEFKNFIPYAIAQVHRPGAPAVLGTAWLAKYEGHYWAVMPYHIGGKKGSKRELYLFNKRRQIRKIPVTIVVNGNAGFHSPDVSIAPLAEEDVKDNVALEVAPADLMRPAYSFGYTVGDFTVKDWLPVRRNFFAKEGFGLAANRYIPTETDEQPWNLSGYCGSPLLQQIDGKWKVVGMHAGSTVHAEGETGFNQSFAISIPDAFQILFNELYHRPISSRDLRFNGNYITSISHTERVKTVEIIRDNEIIFGQELRNFAYPYSDEHAEHAFVSAPMIKGEDILRFYILNDKHQIRIVEFYVQQSSSREILQ